MKKFLSIFIIFAMMLMSMQTVFADSDEKSENLRIELGIAKDAESKNIMEESGIGELKSSLSVKK